MNRSWIGVGAGVVAALFLGGEASAEELVAIKPGVMCASSDALARLTLPSGDSRTHGAAARPDDLSAAVSGGCIDIPLGARVQVQQAFRNTSRVIYAGPDAPAGGVVTVPNVDFAPVGAAPASGAGAPAGYAVAQRVAAGGGMTLVLLQDSRITPAIRDAMEPSGGDPDQAFADAPRLRAEFNARPLKDGQLLLLASDGSVTGRTQLDRPFASIKPAPLHGLPVPTFLFEVNESGGTGSTGPITQLLAPVQLGLMPVQAVPDQGGPSKPINLAATIHEMWRIAPARKGGTEQIEYVVCSIRTNGMGPMYLMTYRFHDGRWTSATRIQGECGELEEFPDRRLFP